MKNIEKYSNTKDALKAYNSLASKPIPFDKWLESEYEEPRGCNAPTYGGPPPRYYEELLSENARLRAALKVAEDALVELQTIY